jgi:hypothetical protein
VDGALDLLPEFIKLLSKLGRPVVVMLALSPRLELGRAVDELRAHHLQRGDSPLLVRVQVGGE